MKIIQLIDLKRQQNRIKDNLDARTQDVLNYGRYIVGSEIQELENRLVDYIGTRHTISCSSGTDVLLLAMMAYGIKPGDTGSPPPLLLSLQLRSSASLRAYVL